MVMVVGWVDNMISLIKDDYQEAYHIDDVLRLMLSDNPPECVKKAGVELAEALESIIIHSLLANCIEGIKEGKKEKDE